MRVQVSLTNMKEPGRILTVTSLPVMYEDHPSTAIQSCLDSLIKEHGDLVVGDEIKIETVE